MLRFKLLELAVRQELVGMTDLKRCSRSSVKTADRATCSKPRALLIETKYLSNPDQHKIVKDRKTHYTDLRKKSNGFTITCT